MPPERFTTCERSTLPILPPPPLMPRPLSTTRPALSVGCRQAPLAGRESPGAGRQSAEAAMAGAAGLAATNPPRWLASATRGRSAESLPRSWASAPADLSQPDTSSPQPVMVLVDHAGPAFALAELWQAPPRPARGRRQTPSTAADERRRPRPGRESAWRLGARLRASCERTGRTGRAGIPSAEAGRPPARLTSSTDRE